MSTATVQEERRKADDLAALYTKLGELASKSETNADSISKLWASHTTVEKEIEAKLSSLTTSVTTFSTQFQVYMASQKSSSETKYDIFKTGWPVLVTLVGAAFFLFQLIDSRLPPKFVQQPPVKVESSTESLEFLRQMMKEQSETMSKINDSLLDISNKKSVKFSK
jgi:hypothetical protein